MSDGATKGENFPRVTEACEGTKAARPGEADMILDVNAEQVTRVKRVTNDIRVCETSHTGSPHANFMSLHIYMQKEELITNYLS